MKAYLIDEISPSDLNKITHFLKKNAVPSKIDQLFWVKIPDELLSTTQFQHRECRPHVFAVELGSNWIKLEFFVRSLTHMRCVCPRSCTGPQRTYVVDFAHRMLEQLSIKT